MRLSRILREYMKNSTIHGVRYVVDENASRCEQCFWILCVVASWLGSWLLISASLDRFQNNAISFVVDTSYRDWKTNFPAIVVCEVINMDNVQNVSERLWGVEHEFFLEESLNEIAYFRGESYHTLHECKDSSKVKCIKENYFYYANLVRSTCEKTFLNCSWKGVEFKCCEYFLTLVTELGTCYAINSLQTGYVRKKLDMYSDHESGHGNLYLQISTDVDIYIIGEEEVPSLATPKIDIIRTTPFSFHERHILKNDITNDDQIRATSVRQRNCLFYDENHLDVHKYYSYTACIVQCRKDMQLKLCNCTSHFMPNTPVGLHCNITGLECLNNYFEILSTVLAKWSYGRKGMVCDCLPSCTEVDIAVVFDASKSLKEEESTITKVQIQLVHLPTERYKRNVVRGTLDLVVSMGGTAGLFIGASLLSIVEIIYYFFVRTCAGMPENRTN